MAYSMDQEITGLDLKTRVRRIAIYAPYPIDWSEADILVHVRSTYSNCPWIWITVTVEL